MGSEHEKIETPGQAQRLTNVANRMLKEARPVQREALAQMLEALQTGGVGAKIPLVQRSVEASNQATSQATKAAEEGMARTGVGGTPFGANILANIGLEGRSRSAAIPAQIAGQLAGAAPGYAGGVVNAALTSLSGAADLDRLVQSFNSQQYASFMKDIKDSLQSVRGTGGNTSQPPDPGPASGVDYPGGDQQYYEDLVAPSRSPYTEGYGRGGY